MQPNLSAQKQSPSPFWQVLSDAEEVRIREVNSPDGEELKELLRKVPGDRRRAFLVDVKQAGEAPSSSYDRAFLLSCVSVLLTNGEALLGRNICRLLLQRNAQDAEAKRLLGICSLELGDWIAARKLFQGLLETQGSEELHFWMALCALAQGSDAQALAHFQRIGTPEKLPDDVRFRFFKECGNCHTRLGNWEEAEECYGQAKQLRGETPCLCLNFGTLELQRGRTEFARTWFQKALAQTDLRAKAFCGVAMSYFAEKKDSEALPFFLRALDEDKRHLVSLYHVVLLAHRSDDYSHARERLEACLALEPKNPDVLYSLAAILFKEKRYADSRVHVEEALKSAPGHLKARSLLQQLSAIFSNGGNQP